jgi:hypothetical protein
VTWCVIKNTDKLASFEIFTYSDALLDNGSVNTFQPTRDQQQKDIRCWVTDR